MKESGLLLVMCLVVNLAFSAMHVYSLVAILVCDGGSCRFRRKGLNALEFAVWFDEGGGTDAAVDPRYVVIAVVEVVLQLLLGWAAKHVWRDFGWRSFAVAGNDPRKRALFGTFFQLQAFVYLEYALLIILLVIGNQLELYREAVLRYGGSSSGLAAQQVEWNLVVGLCGMVWARAASRAFLYERRRVMYFLVPLGGLYPAYLSFKWYEFDQLYAPHGVVDNGAVSLAWVWATMIQPFFAMCLVWRLVILGVYHRLRASLGLHLARSVELSRKRALPVELREKLDDRQRLAVARSMQGCGATVHFCDEALSSSARNLFLQLSADAESLKWSWHDYLLVGEVGAVTPCSDASMSRLWPDAMHSHPNAPRCAASSASQPSLSLADSRCTSEAELETRESPSSSICAMPSCTTRAAALSLSGVELSDPSARRGPPPPKLASEGAVLRSFSIAYGGAAAARGAAAGGAGGGRRGAAELILTCATREECEMWVEALQALVKWLPVLHEEGLSKPELDFVKRAFKDSDRNDDGCLPLGSVANDFLHRLHISGDDPICVKAQRDVFGDALLVGHVVGDCTFARLPAPLRAATRALGRAIAAPSRGGCTPTTPRAPSARRSTCTEAARRRAGCNRSSASTPTVWMTRTASTSS